MSSCCSFPCLMMMMRDGRSPPLRAYFLIFCNDVLRYYDGCGDLWRGGPSFPPESELEVDLELVQVNNQRDDWSIMVMGFVSNFGVCGVKAYNLLTGSRLPISQLACATASTKTKKGEERGDLQLDEDGWPIIHDEVGEEEDETFSAEGDDAENDAEEEEEVELTQEQQEEKRRGEEKMREEAELERHNRSTRLEAKTIFSSPKFNIE